MYINSVKSTLQQLAAASQIVEESTYTPATATHHPYDACGMNPCIYIQFDVFRISSPYQYVFVSQTCWEWSADARFDEFERSHVSAKDDSY